MRIMTTTGLVLTMAIGVFGMPNGRGGKNLVENGSFDNEENHLKGWRIEYPGSDMYASNPDYIEIIDRLDGRRWVVCHNPGLASVQGTKMDSKPIPFDPKASYKFSMEAKTTGPPGRILIEGYRWKPGIRPHENPQLHELRKCYKFKKLFFGSKKEGEFSGVEKSWSKAERTFPEKDMSPLAMKMFKRIEFLLVHIVKIGVPDGKLYIDNVRLVKTDGGGGKPPHPPPSWKR